jgi:hypothetical protein
MTAVVVSLRCACLSLVREYVSDSSAVGPVVWAPAISQDLYWTMARDVAA